MIDFATSLPQGANRVQSAKGWAPRRNAPTFLSSPRGEYLPAAAAIAFAFFAIEPAGSFYRKYLGPVYFRQFAR
jgi:hypothetical protein